MRTLAVDPNDSSLAELLGKLEDQPEPMLLVREGRPVAVLTRARDAEAGSVPGSIEAVQAFLNRLPPGIGFTEDEEAAMRAQRNEKLTD